MSFDLNQSYKDLQAKGEKTSVKGGCHCGAIKYTVDVPIPDDGVIRATKCNCSFCTKFGTTSFSASPDDFKLVSPSSKQEIQGDYTKDPKTAHRYFCAKCGVHVFQEGSYEFEGSKYDFFLVNAATFDQPQPGVDLKKVKISYWDGLNDNWTAGMSDEPWGHGLR